MVGQAFLTAGIVATVASSVFGHRATLLQCLLASNPPVTAMDAGYAVAVRTRVPTCGAMWQLLPKRWSRRHRPRVGTPQPLAEIVCTMKYATLTSGVRPVRHARVCGGGLLGCQKRCQMAFGVGTVPFSRWQFVTA